MAFQAYGRLLVEFSYFKYLWRVLVELDDECPAVVGNLRNACKRWTRMLRILGGYGADPQTSGNFYMAVVQASLLFGKESCVMYLRIGRTLGSFHHRFVLLTGKDVSKEWHGGQVDLSISGRENEGSGAGGGGDVLPLTTEYCLPVYHHLMNTGAMSGGGATARGAGVDKMVGSGWN